ncbi:MAG: hypothetical protein KAX49_00785 [Halanaerobiales bacterium]|nr:hypothetical protein [Halanaerobiales bacterium]
MNLKAIVKSKQFIIGLVLGLCIAVIAVSLTGWFLTRNKSQITTAFGQVKKGEESKAQGEVSLLRVTPSGDVNLSSDLIISFSAPMIAEEEVGKEDLRDLIQFKPKIDGSYKWLNQMTLIFTPSKNLKPSTTYKGTYNRDYVPEGAKLVGKSLEFRTVERQKVQFLGLNVLGEMSLKPTLEFTFSNDMNYLIGEISEEELIHFKPSVSGRYYWSSPSKLALVIEEALHSETTYRAELNTDIFNQDEYSLTGKTYDEFKTSGPKEANIVRMEPKGEVDPKENLTFTFSKDVANKSQIGVNYKNEMIQVEPAISGSYRWINSRQLRFLPEVPFQPASHYKVTILPEILAGDAFYLNEPEVFEFDTSQFKVVSSKISFSNISETYSELNARLNFNYPVKPEELVNYLRLYLIKDGKESLLSYKIKPYRTSDSFEVLVYNIKRTENKREVRLKILSGLICDNGTEGLQEEYNTTVQLSALDPIKVWNVDSNADYSTGTIEIEFSRAVEAESVESFIEISPEVSYRVKVFRDVVRLKSEDFKPGESYNLTIKAGLPSENAAPLQQDYTRKIYIPDLSPLIRFNSTGYYLSNQGNLNLGLETVNLDKVDLKIYKIYANNLVHFFSEYRDEPSNYSMSNIGKMVKEFTLELNNQKNEILKTSISLEEYLGDQRKGIYQVFARDRDSYWRNASKVVIATDIGIVTKKAKDEMVVWVNSLSTLDPLFRAKVSILSYNNQILASDETNLQGVVRFEEMDQLMEEFSPYIVLVEYDDDFSFLRLDDGKIDMTDFDISGRSFLSEGYEAYLYADRGVYRSGDKANITALIRGTKVSVPEEFPVRLQVTDPTGKIFNEFVNSTASMGAAEFEILLPDYAKTGKYNAKLYVADSVIGSTSFSVEEFMPERIKVEVMTDQSSYNEGEEAEINVKGINLFGPPAVGRKVELSIKLDTIPFSTPQFASYSFGDSGVNWKAITEDLGLNQLDENGEYTYLYRFPDNLKPGNMMKAVFSATVREDGGRAVNAYKVINFHPYDSYIGMKRMGEYYGKVNEKYPIQFVEVDEEGNLVNSSELEIKIYRIIWHSLWWHDENGNWHYESEEEEEEVHRETIEPGIGERIFTFTPRDYGKYKVVISNTENGSRSSLNFYATGWGYSPWAMSNSNKIELDLDQESYRPGDLAQIQVKAPFSGKALVTVERDKLYDVQVVEFKNNTGLVAVNVREDWKPNVYVSVQLIRSIESLEEHAPVRAFGTIALPIDCSKNELEVNITAEKEMRPNQKTEVEIQVLDASEEAYVTLAAVDEGILQLTNFVTPDPFNFFFGKVRLDVESYDLYNLLLPEVEKTEISSSPGGDADMYAESMRKENLNPVSVNRVKPVSLWSGIVKLDEEGKTKITLDLPQFNGTLRLMAVAFDGSRFGNERTKVIVRDPIVLTPTYPRFVAGTDKFQIPVGVYNGTGEDGEFSVKLNADGPVDILNETEKKVILDAGQEKMIYFDLQAQNAVGKVVFNLEVKGNGKSSKIETELAVRPAVPLVHEFLAGTITQDEPTKIKLSTEWVPGTEKYSLILSPFPAVKFSGSLNYLLKYPYGCAEQTTSKLFPLLYFDKLAEKAEPELFENGSVDYYINEGIQKLQSMQLEAGDFSYWPGDYYSYRWSSLYVSHFLVEARKADYEVANHVYDKMLGYVRSIARESAYDQYELQNKVYALYILALAGQPNVSDMAYVKNHKLDEIYQDSRAMLAAAYYYAGERAEVKNLLPYSFMKSDVPRETGSNFNSSVRTDAIILSVLADIDPTHPSIPVLVQRLSENAETGYWGTTQENAFAFMAIGKMLNLKSQDKYTGSVLLNGEELATFDNEEDLILKDDYLADGEITINLNGVGENYYFTQVSGVPLSTEVDEYDSGIEVKREYLDKNGEPLDLNAVKQGELVVAKITVNPMRDELNNMVIVDMLPAGLEIENPRLGSHTSIDWIYDEYFPVEYMDIRDDRLLLFTSLYYQDTYTFYYTLRAVTVGEFILPPIKAECMYEPEISSISSSGKINIVK